jgi:hypothetical protein
MASAAQVLPLLPPPERTDALSAVARAVGAAQRGGWTYKALARVVGCDPDTIERAANCVALIEFDKVARIAFHVPEARPFLAALWEMGASAEPTADDRFARIERDLTALRRVVESRGGE